MGTDAAVDAGAGKNPNPETATLPERDAKTSSNVGTAPEVGADTNSGAVKPVGGGKLHQAEIIIRQDRHSLFDGMAEFKIDKAGKLGPVSIVAESDQSFIVTTSDKPWWEVRRRSLHLKKDLIELVIYTK